MKRKACRNEGQNAPLGVSSLHPPEAAETSQVAVTRLPTRHARGVARHPKGGISRIADPKPLTLGYPWQRTGSADVERLVSWTYGPQMADRFATSGLFELEARAAGYEWRNSSTDGCATIENIARVGCRIDISGAGRETVHPVAEAVVGVVAAHDAAELLRYHGVLDSRPNWRGPKRWFIPERWKVEGEDAMWVYTERTSQPYCPLIQVASAETVERARATYLRWWDALDDVAWRLGQRALGFTVLAPQVDREPWLQKPVDGAPLI